MIPNNFKATADDNGVASIITRENITPAHDIYLLLKAGTTTIKAREIADYLNENVSEVRIKPV